MDNQHQLIKGYRDLSAEEVALRNRIKEEGGRLQGLLEEVRKHVTEQFDRAHMQDVGAAGVEVKRLRAANPYGWCAIAEKDLQTGLMALTRAVAQPGSF